MFEFVTWVLCWLPPIYCAASLACRFSDQLHLRGVTTCLGAMLYAYAACLLGILVGFTPVRVLGISFLGGALCLFLDLRARRFHLPTLRGLKRSIRMLPHILPLVLTGFLLGWLLWLSILVPPHFADGAVTHAVAPAIWYADKAFSWPVSGFENAAFDTVNGYLKFPHFLFYYNAAAALGSSAYLTLGQYQGLLLLLVSCVAVCRELNLRTGAALVALLATLAVPEVLVQVLECYLDVLVAASLAVVLLACLLVYKQPTTIRLYALAVATGFAMSIKVTGPFQTALPWILLTGFGAWHLWAKAGPCRAMKAVVVSALIVASLGGSWYFASWIRLGNPLHPFQVSLLDRVLFPGITAYGGERWLLEPKGLNRLTALPVTWGERWGDYSLGSPFNGLGPLFAVAGFPAFWITAVSAVLRGLRVYVMFVVVAILIVALHPSAWQPRYSIVAASFGGIALAHLFQSSGRGFRGLIGSLVVAGTAAAFIHAVPYQVCGFHQPFPYWRASINSSLRAHLSARGLFPDTNSVHQRLLLDPHFAGKRVLLAPHLHFGEFLRPKIDNRLLQVHDLSGLSDFVRENKPEYIYVAVSPRRREKDEAALAAVRRLGKMVQELPQLPSDQRLLSYYMRAASREYLFRVVPQGAAGEAQP